MEYINSSFKHFLGKANFGGLGTQGGGLLNFMGWGVRNFRGWGAVTQLLWWTQSGGTLPPNQGKGDTWVPTGYPRALFQDPAWVGGPPPLSPSRGSSVNNWLFCAL